MKKLILLAGVFALILSSCTQDLPVAPVEDVLQDVVITGIDGTKGFKNDDISCDQELAQLASITYQEVEWTTDPTTATVVVVGGVDQIFTKEIAVFYVDGIMYTQALKLPAGEYQVTHMELLDADGDILVAVPYEGSQVGLEVTDPLPIDFTVSPFTKTEINVSILCYFEGDYEKFGFTWFQLDVTKKKNKFFFGDLCTKFFNDYDVAGSKYFDAGYSDLVMVDMPALFELTLQKWDESTSTWVDYTHAENTVMNNDANIFTPNPTPFELYYDFTEVDAKFKLDLGIYVKQGSGFDYQPFGTYYYQNEVDDKLYSDANMTVVAATPGDDGVYDFVIGNCNADDADIVFAPWMNLPESLDLTLTYPGTVGYFDGWMDNFKLDGVNASGFDFSENAHGSSVPEGIFCFDKDHYITVGSTPTEFNGVQVYSTLYPEYLPSNVIVEHWDMLNWLINNLDSYTFTVNDLQEALWMIQKHTAVSPDVAYIAATQTGKDMANDAISNGVGYSPLPGGWAAVILDVDPSTGTNAQTLFVRVDP